MKSFILLVLLLIPSVSLAATVSWDSNTEPDIKSYKLYKCQVLSCTPAEADYFLEVQHVAGVPRQSVAVSLANLSGGISVKATDTIGNESLFSVKASFLDQQAPLAPANLTVQ